LLASKRKAEKDMMSFQHLKEQIYDIDYRRQEESLLYLAEIVFSYAVSTLEDPCVQYWTLGFEYGSSDSTPTTWKNERKLEKITESGHGYVYQTRAHPCQISDTGSEQHRFHLHNRLKSSSNF
jgi:hypothetical protein